MKRPIYINLIMLLFVLSVSACGKTETKPKEEAAVPVSEQQESTESIETEEPPEENNIEKTKEQKDQQADITEEQAEKALKEISDKLSGYMWVALMTESSGDFTKAGDDYNIDLTDAEKIRAAALSSESDGVIDTYFREGEGGLIQDKDAETGIDNGVFHGTSVSKKQLEENALDFFGLLADIDDLQENPQCDLYDAVKYTDRNGTYALAVDAELETETNIENHECRISKNGDSFIGEVDMFWGYWGQLEMNPGFSNYTVTYTLTPDDRSKYGLAVSGINVRMTKDNALIEETGSAEEKQQEPFGEEMPIDAETQRKMNIFLSNFSEAGLMKYDMENRDFQDILWWVHIWTKINKWKSIEHEDVPGEGLCEKNSLENINSVLDKYLGFKMTKEQTESFSSPDETYGFFFKDTSFYTPAADGESYTLLSIVSKAADLGDNKLKLSFTVYSQDLDAYFEGKEKDEYYKLAGDAASKNPELEQMYKGYAIVRKDGSSYKLEYLEQD